MRAERKKVATTKTLQEQLKKLQAKNRYLRAHAAWCSEYQNTLCKERDTFRQQRDCIYQKKHKGVFTGVIEVHQEEIRIQYKCPLCKYETERRTEHLSERHESVLKELGIVPKGSE